METVTLIYEQYVVNVKLTAEAHSACVLCAGPDVSPGAAQIMKCFVAPFAYWLLLLVYMVQVAIDLLLHQYSYFIHCACRPPYYNALVSHGVKKKQNMSSIYSTVEAQVLEMLASTWYSSGS